MKQIITFFKGRKASRAREYTGLSDFLLHAPLEEQKKAIARAAHKANEDQLKVFEAARLKTKVN